MTQRLLSFLSPYSETGLFNRVVRALYAFGIRRGFEVSEECTGCSGCCDADLGRAVRKVLHHDIQVFKAWLYSCVRNYCLMELRRRSGNNFVGLDEKFMEFCDDFNLEYSRETDRQEKALQECMEALPEKTTALHFVIFLWMNCLIKKSGKLRVLL